MTLDHNGVMSPLANAGGTFGDAIGNALDARFNTINQLAFDPTASTIYIADTGNHRIKKFTFSTGTVAFFAGTGKGGLDNENQANNAQLNSPLGVHMNSVGNVYIADTLNHRVRKVSPDGSITTQVGNGIPTFAGDGGAATQASLNSPSQVCFFGNDATKMYIADTFNNRIRRKDLGTQIITTIVGNGTTAFGGDVTTGPLAGLNRPSGILCDSKSGDLFIADTGNSCIRRFNLASNTVSLLGTRSGSLVGTPSSLTIDACGNIVFTDKSNKRVSAIQLSPDVELNGTVFIIKHCAGLSAVTSPCTNPIVGISYVDTICSGGSLVASMKSLGYDSILKPCSPAYDAGIGYYVVSLCIPGSSLLRGNDFQVLPCSSPPAGYFTISVCLPGSHSSIGKDTVILSCTTTVPDGYALAEPCIPGSYNSTGKDSQFTLLPTSPSTLLMTTSDALQNGMSAPAGSQLNENGGDANLVIVIPISICVTLALILCFTLLVKDFIKKRNKFGRPANIKLGSRPISLARSNYSKV